MIITFSVLDWKYPFWENLVEIIKIVSLSLNLILTLLRICRIQWWCLFFFSVLDQIYLFWANLLQKIKIVSLSWNLVIRLIQICRIKLKSLIRICRIRWWFFFETGNTLSGQILYKKIKSVILSWNLRPTLLLICRIQWWWCLLFLFTTRNTLFG